MPRFYHAAKTHFAEVFADEGPRGAAEMKEAMGDDLPAGVSRLPREPSAAESPAIDDPPWRLLEKRRLDPHRAAAWGYERTSVWRVVPCLPAQDVLH